MKTFQNNAVAAKFSSYPAEVRAKLLALRTLIFDVAQSTQGVGQLEETLKWDEPAYLTSETGSGSTIRIDWKKAKPSQCGIYFNCQTNLIETFRSLYPKEFKYEGNRAMIFQLDDPIPEEPLKLCIATALTYHLEKRKTGKV